MADRGVLQNGSLVSRTIPGIMRTGLCCILMALGMMSVRSILCQRSIRLAVAVVAVVEAEMAAASMVEGGSAAVAAVATR